MNFAHYKATIFTTRQLRELSGIVEHGVCEALNILCGAMDQRARDDMACKAVLGQTDDVSKDAGSGSDGFCRAQNIDGQDCDLIKGLQEEWTESGSKRYCLMEASKVSDAATNRCLALRKDLVNEIGKKKGMFQSSYKAATFKKVVDDVDVYCPIRCAHGVTSSNEEPIQANAELDEAQKETEELFAEVKQLPDCDDMPGSAKSMSHQKVEDARKKHRVAKTALTKKTNDVDANDANVPPCTLRVRGLHG